MKHRFFACHHCGNMAALIKDNGVPLFCCGEKMYELKADSTDASAQKHKPVYTVSGNKAYVTAGSVEHPMSNEHYIEWICLETDNGIQYIHLKPDDEPKAVFALCEGDSVKAVYAFCNQHELWRD